jgi:hydroxymethylbilane synthase
MNRPLVIGTRGSALALAQVDIFKKALRAQSLTIPVEIRKIVTAGDRQPEIKLVRESAAGVKGLFTKEIEQLLLQGVIDVAVHSLKDLPGQTPSALAVTAVLERADTSDVLLAKYASDIHALPPGAAVATSSVRRARQLLWIRPDLRVQEIRGNVPTRVEKLRAGNSWDAIVLARAGLDRLRLELSDFQVSSLPILPAVGQGAIALQSRRDSVEVNGLLARINHLPTFLCIRAERELLRLLDGDCNLPVGVRTTIAGERLEMEAILFGKEGGAPIRALFAGSVHEPEDAARALYEQLDRRH